MKYRKKPVVINAIKWTPNEKGWMPWGKEFAKCIEYKVSCINLSLFIPTLEGEMEAKVGDWIIKGVKGEFSNEY